MNLEFVKVIDFEDLFIQFYHYEIIGSTYNVNPNERMRGSLPH